MNRDQWLEERRSGVGGSDVAAILGLSKWSTPLAVYLDKRGEAPPQQDNEAMRWGRYLEPVVRQAYADETGRVVHVPTGMLRHPEHEFMIANIDGVAGGEHEPPRLFEAKTARTAEGWGEPGSDEVPQAYLLQVQHYMAVTAIAVADVAVLIGGADFRVYEVPEDRELQEMLIEAEADFWSRVQRGVPPEPVSYADMQARYGRASRAASVVASVGVERAIARLRTIKAEREALDVAEEEMRAIVMGALGDADTLVDPVGKTLATWKASSPAKRLDTAALEAELPDVYERFTKAVASSRRFLVKSA
jgi:putative phage-type endonuclease